MKPPNMYSFTLLVISSYILLGEAFLKASNVGMSGIAQTLKRNDMAKNSENKGLDSSEDTSSSLAGQTDGNRKSKDYSSYTFRDKWLVDEVTRIRRSTENEDDGEGNNRSDYLTTDTEDVAPNEESSSFTKLAHNVSKEVHDNDPNRARKIRAPDLNTTSESINNNSTVDTLPDLKDGKNDKYVDKTPSGSHSMLDNNEEGGRFTLSGFYREFRKWKNRPWRPLHFPQNTTPQSSKIHNNTSGSTTVLDLHTSTYSGGERSNEAFSMNMAVTSDPFGSNSSDLTESYFENIDNSTFFNPQNESESNNATFVQPPKLSTSHSSLPFVTNGRRHHEEEDDGNITQKYYHEHEQNSYRNKDKNESDVSQKAESRQNDSLESYNDSKHIFHENYFTISSSNDTDIEIGGNSSTLEKSINGKIENEEQMVEEEKNNDNDKITSSNCLTCREVEADVKLLRLKMFQNLLIQKLRLDQKDTHREAYRTRNESRVPKLPDSIVEQTLKDNAKEIEKDEFHARDQELIVSGDDMGRDCVKIDSTGCYTFNMKARVKGQVAEAHLWIYKMKDINDVNVQTFNLYELERLKSGRLAHSSMIVSVETVVREGWVVLNMTRSLRKWAHKRKGYEMLAVRCVTCATRSHRALYGTKLDYKPLLVIKYDNDNHASRHKRSQSCDPRYECCKRELVVNLQDIGMNDIIQPRHLSVGYCYGDCNQINHYTYNHTLIKQRTRWSDSLAHQHSMRQQLKPCCAPLVLKDIFIMTSEGDGTMVRKLLPKVIVERCGCV